MGFFKKLKERLLALEGIDPKKETKPKPIKEGLADFAIYKRENKINKKNEKKKIQIRKKEKKLDKYIVGMSKSRSSFSEKITEIQSRHNEIDKEFFEELEEILIMSDISVKLVMDIIDEIKKEVKKENVRDMSLIAEIIADKIFVIYTNQTIVDTTLDVKNERVNVILMVGVNGAGKTTSIAKLASKFSTEGKNVLIAAADTFRAGGVEQLSIWAERIGVDIIKSEKQNADPASVVFDAVKKAKEDKYDILIIDTAGRLQNKVNLMNELAKMSKIITKEIPGAPHESLLVVDATTGQNGVSQAKHFKDVTPISGIILTKMDGTSKGGIILTIKDELEMPVKFIGLGESLDDLQEFNLDAFIYGMTKGLIDESK
ncbi:signal recognition particle-docking protein FtsY [Candidatus Mycoplasma mahonii]|uniref:signal recognition particle-docking protein FtsY n=1 Tax=Candidatus Mycoplasma mahonii TaxID=3004105 RepID=UPI0026EA03A3|nr:signal recognition particle-docking protein FtsY [Candidatus Mycoplasma mahonii]WKX02528.1 signal recognition particle-docking protein FtsY [Candidatus Mycoplasma mahonii]